MYPAYSRARGLRLQGGCPIQCCTEWALIVSPFPVGEWRRMRQHLRNAFSLFRRDTRKKQDPLFLGEILIWIWHLQIEKSPLQHEGNQPEVSPWAKAGKTEQCKHSETLMMSLSCLIDQFWGLPLYLSGLLGNNTFNLLRALFHISMFLLNPN